MALKRHRKLRELGVVEGYGNNFGQPIWIRLGQLGVPYTLVILPHQGQMWLVAELTDPSSTAVTLKTRQNREVQVSSQEGSGLLPPSSKSAVMNRLKTHVSSFQQPFHRGTEQPDPRPSWVFHGKRENCTAKKHQGVANPDLFGV